MAESLDSASRIESLVKYKQISSFQFLEKICYINFYTCEHLHFGQQTEAAIVCWIEQLHQQHSRFQLPLACNHTVTV